MIFSWTFLLQDAQIAVTASDGANAYPTYGPLPGNHLLSGL
ncbi:hypothetical protein NI35_3746 [Salmonella enterica subsp. enterica serovar Cerro]|uniref:Uncharacterized protein n=1 Tax=Salmonella enterica subsp. enterica serovar Cubana str. 76814 TaxID=1192560 RepID=V7ITA3_SALET|nr:hypothetical protein GW13_PRO3483 [Salmonella enterica subsp. enterica serovar Cerro]ETA89133.1 hypothetical protein A628_00856 [Salmonella enterica subsp. enterica serovar Cubana str. 76814]KMN28511.1 hypothetical protein NI35_3746 [Salmonella enterica subsp. enterica serovar Cerro]PQB17471.1 hypothetical protein CWT02_3483 [Salmonella enterica subsp. enterica serovar Cubana]